MKQLSRVVARNTIAGIIAQLLIKVISFTFSVLIVRQLGPDVYGQYAAINAFGVIFAFITDLGLSNYVVREVASLRDKPGGQEKIEKLYANNVGVRAVLSVVTLVVMVLTAWITGRSPEVTAAIAFSGLSFFIWCVLGPNQSLLAGYERLDLIAGANVLSQLVFISLGALALWAGASYFGLIAASLVSLGVMAGICVRSLRKLHVHLSKPDPTQWLYLLRSCLPFGIITFSQGISYKFDSILLNVFRSDAETGYYNAAYTLIFSLVLISNMFNTSLYPSLTRHTAGDATPQELAGVYERAIRYLMVIALPITIGTWALSDQIVNFLYGSNNGPTAQALQILIWVVPLMFASEFLSYLVIIAGRESRVARALIISIIFNVTLNLIFVPLLGLTAASIMTVVTEAILVIQYLFLLWPILRPLNWGHALLRPAITAVLMGILVLSLRGLPLAANVLLGAVCYGGLAVAFGVLGHEELHFVRNLRRDRTKPSQSL